MIGILGKFYFIFKNRIIILEIIRLKFNFFKNQFQLSFEYVVFLNIYNSLSYLKVIYWLTKFEI